MPACNPAFVAETPTGAHINVAFAGPIPSAADPGFLVDTTEVSLAFTSGGAGDFADFTRSLQDRNRLNAIPRNGSAFSFTCDATGCPAGSASFTQLDIITTDGSTAGLIPFAMPAPVTSSVRIQCRVAGAATINVPAAYSALIQSSGATRIQTTFTRLNPIGSTPRVFSGAGHAVRGFTN